MPKLSNYCLWFQDSSKTPEISANGNDAGQLLIMASSDDKSANIQAPNGSTGLVSTVGVSTAEENKETSDDVEKEERRKIASKLLGKQGKLK